MFGIFAQPPVFDVVQPSGDHVIVHSMKKPRMCRNVQVRLRMGDPPKLHKYTVYFIWFKRSGYGGYDLGCKLVEPRTLPEDKPAVVAKRTTQRHEATFRVVSRKLPGFQAMTLDMSESGLQLATRGPMDQALVFEMRLEPELSGYETVEFRGRVMWCKEEKRGEWRVGIEYLFLDDEARERLNELEAFLKKAKSAEIYHRTLMGADQVLNKRPEEQAEEDQGSLN